MVRLHHPNTILRNGLINNSHNQRLRRLVNTNPEIIIQTPSCLAEMKRGASRLKKPL
jgi:hypothetical protein